jgi:hypothetical protein
MGSNQSCRQFFCRPTLQDVYDPVTNISITHGLMAHGSPERDDPNQERAQPVHKHVMKPNTQTCHETQYTNMS